MSAHLWTWRACPGVCSLPWLLGGQSVHVHGPGVLVWGCAACPGSSVDRACMSTDLVCLSRGVQPALAPEWTQRARPWPWSLPWLVPRHVVCVSVDVEPVLGLVAVTGSLCESAPPSCPAGEVGAATLASCLPPLLREALGRDVRKQPRVGSESLAPSPRGPSRPRRSRGSKDSSRWNLSVRPGRSSLGTAGPEAAVLIVDFYNIFIKRLPLSCLAKHEAELLPGH